MSDDLVNAPNAANSLASNDDKNLATITHLGGTVFSIFPAFLFFLQSLESVAAHR